MAENPFAGTWTVDYSKSHVTGQTIGFTPEAGDKVRLTNTSGSYTFKLDGSNATNNVGLTVQWKQIDDRNWKEFRKEGSMAVTDTWNLSTDANTLTVATSGTRPSGQQINETATFTRVAPGKGFFGKWKTTKYQDNSPTTMQIGANGDNGIIWDIPEIKGSLSLTFDGKEATPIGPTITAGLTLSATKVDPRSFELTEKIKGKVVFQGQYTVSADGSTMTEVGGAPGAPPVRVVFHKS
jgi:hypothetical protein